MSKTGPSTSSEANDTEMERGTSVVLSAPWGGDQGASSGSKTATMCLAERADSGLSNRYVKEGTRVHVIYIREEARTRRLGLVLAFLLILAATAVILFAPEEKEVSSYWIGAALIIFASGAVGFSRVWGQAAGGYMRGDMSKSSEPVLLLVLSARSGVFDGSRLTLNDVPLAVYFSDRPRRIAGHVSVAQLIELWDEGPNSLAEDPPNAVLSILGETERQSRIENAVIELRRPCRSESSIVFDVRVLNGTVPAKFGAASLFVDEIINGSAWTGT